MVFSLLLCVASFVRGASGAVEPYLDPFGSALETANQQQGLRIEEMFGSKSPEFVFDPSIESRMEKREVINTSYWTDLDVLFASCIAVNRAA